MGSFYYDDKGYPRWKDNNKLVHKSVAEKKVGSKIGSDRVVNHKDGNKANFRRDNLRVMSRPSHSRLHSGRRSKLF